MFKFKRDTEVLVKSDKNNKTISVKAKIEAIDESSFEELDELTNKYFEKVNEMIKKISM